MYIQMYYIVSIGLSLMRAVAILYSSNPRLYFWTYVHLLQLMWVLSAVPSYTSLSANVVLFNTSQYGRSPLHEACANAQSTVVTLLLDHGANVHTLDKVRVPLHVCVQIAYMYSTVYSILWTDVVSVTI